MNISPASKRKIIEGLNAKNHKQLDQLSFTKDHTL